MGFTEKFQRLSRSFGMFLMKSPVPIREHATGQIFHVHPVM